MAVKNKSGSDDGKLHPYRADSWNEANHNATNKKEYPKGMPDGYKVDAKKPTPTSSSMISMNNKTANATTFATNTTTKALSKSANTTANATLAKNATKNATLAKSKDGEEEPSLHIYRHDAWNEGHLNNTDKDAYDADSPQAYVVEPMEIGGQSFLVIKDPVKLHFYRHDAWNEANLNATHQKEYGTNPLTAHGATLPEHSTDGYKVEPMDISAGQG
jgi:hypothetical protein